MPSGLVLRLIEYGKIFSDPIEGDSETVEGINLEHSGLLPPSSLLSEHLKRTTILNIIFLSVYFKSMISSLFLSLLH